MCAELSQTPGMSSRLRIAQLVPDTEAEGPGRRFALWVQGCSLRCPGCCNPEMFSAVGGTEVEVDALAERILGTPGIEGISLLGGEPFEQAPTLAALCRRIRPSGLSVMVFSGFTLAELRACHSPGVAELLAETDLLVDGRYERNLPERRRRWIGSANQVMHFLTGRYAPSDPRFSQPNTVELRLVGRALQVSGWPAAADKVRS